MWRVEVTERTLGTCLARMVVVAIAMAGFQVAQIAFRSICTVTGFEIFFSKIII